MFHPGLILKSVSHALHGVAFYATWLAMAINTSWFVEKLDSKRLSQRKLAKLMGLDPSAVSLMFRGKREIKLTEAVQIAALLGVAVSDVLANAGIDSTGGDTLSVVGWIDGHGEVHLEDTGERIEAPPSLPPHCVAVQCRTLGSALESMDRWLIIYQQPNGHSPDILDRLCVAKVKGGIVLFGTVKRGYKPGTYNIVGAYALNDVKFDWASPVLWIRP